MLIDESAYLAHYGILRRSGRYPWGSGGNVPERSRSFLDYVKDMLSKGLTEAEIARGLSTPEDPFTTTDLRALKTIAKNQMKQADIAMAQRLKDKGYSNTAIGERMGLNESSVRGLLAPGEKDKADLLQTTASMLRDKVDEKGLIDIGSGVEHHLGISREKLATAVAMLKQEGGYEIHNVQVDQLGTTNKTTIKVLAPPGTSYRDVVANKDKIQQVAEFSDDGGRTYLGIQKPLSIDSKRIDVRYAEQGGADADGVIYVRPGVDDISLGGARYAQVRIAVDGTHYLKGMAMYKDDLPAGVDLQFNTNKSKDPDKLKAMKAMKDDPENPFGSAVRQIVDPETRKVKSAMNIVNEEGNWDDWSRNLSSQMLSKQSPKLAKEQLAMTYERRKQELEDIQKLTNPAVRKKLLEAYADSADSASVHLKAAALPRQRTQVILPINSLKDNEIYAPNFKNGDRVALVRYPHGGIFEIPELTVNNNHPKAKKALGNAKDAVGINSKVAERLSGADFDGDTVLVIPNKNGKIKTMPALEGLRNFDPQRSYPAYQGMPKMKPQTKQTEMGKVSNLITDMTIQGANAQELARAVRHSMVVIDAEKHNLNYKQSAIDNGIPQLKAKYQPEGGASTLISRAGSRVDVARGSKPRPMAKGGPIDKATGRKVYDEPESYVNSKGQTVVKKVRSQKLAETQNAHTLSSGTTIEKIYADHSNNLKSLANQARKELINTPSVSYSPSAKKVYAKEVASLNAKLNVALRNRPLERQAQVIANASVSAKRAANPDMDHAEVKKLKGLELTKARIATGAGKDHIKISDSEWGAIQAGAISNNKLNQILDNSDLDRVKELATPRQNLVMTNTKQSRAKSMLASGYTQAEVAEALGVPLSTLKSSIGSW